MTDHTARLDHVVLWVSDPVAAADFYEQAVGLEPLRVAEFKDGSVSFPSVRIDEGTILDLAPVSMAPRMTMLPGADRSAGRPVNHVCLALTEDGYDSLRARLEERDVPVSDHGRHSYGARGPAVRSFYFTDPDGNVFEARYYEEG
ncbi:VOC family protein [Streptomyces antnestii]|uniref:VOC family protein n=1 Tax=Streptomyces antnestii TaxID=2494256 RepID=A0A3S3UED3_9ACTN|nr:VOC family protein [Streptomyces sp. San01]RVU22116.1 VOC family protein [Streptomyces sp. San01]